MLKPDAQVVVYMRPGCHVCARVKDFLTEREVPFETRDVDRDPLTPRELWELFNRKADRLRVPFTALNDGEDVVLGFDPMRLEGVFVHGELGGVQVATAVDRTTVYDDFTTAELDSARWNDRAPESAGPPRIVTGDGQLRIAGPAAYVSTERFATLPGARVAFQVDVAVDVAVDAGAPVGGPVGAVALRDLPTGVLLGFEVGDKAILAVHQRLSGPGVAADAEHFSHRVITDVETSSGQRHRYRIEYEHDTAAARWYVDEQCVYAASTPLRVEGFSLVMGAHGQATYGPWQVGPGG